MIQDSNRALQISERAAIVPPHQLGAGGRWTALVALQIVIGIHVALTPMHLDEMLYIGVLFTVGNALLFAAMLALVSDRSQAAGWWLGSVVCLGEFAGFVASRTIGLPMSYHETWATAPEDYLGLVSLGCELAVVAAAARHAYHARPPHPRSTATPRLPNGDPGRDRGDWVRSLQRNALAGGRRRASRQP